MITTHCVDVEREVLGGVPHTYEIPGPGHFGFGHWRGCPGCRWCTPGVMTYVCLVLAPPPYATES